MIPQAEWPPVLATLGEDLLALLLDHGRRGE